MTEWFNFSSHLDPDRVLAILSQKDGEHYGRSLAEHREHLAEELGFVRSTIAVPHQVHGIQVGLAVPGQIHPDTDGLVTNNPEVVLSLQVADCSPVFLYHKPSGTRGLVHAGWRGLASGIISQMAEMLKSMGPTIEKECYEVGEEVAYQFPSGVRASNDHGRYMLDLAAALRGQLNDEGIRENNIYQACICTRCDTRCHSYRREGKQAGRMIAFFAEREHQKH
jgi:YfiH family protein